MRLDQKLFFLGKVQSRTQAQEFIKSGKVSVFFQEAWVKVYKPSFFCDEQVEIRIDYDDPFLWVSRAGKKLEGAIEKQKKWSLEDKVVLDIGQSTGGFTQCCLFYGAKKVIGVDTGVGQLHTKLRKDKRIECYERLDARNLRESEIHLSSVEVLVMDVSFISSFKILDSLRGLLQPNTKCFLLVKPQFEVGRVYIGKGGIIRDPLVHLLCEKNLLQQFFKWNLEVKNYFPSSIKGKNGNQEFFCCFVF